MDNRLKRDQYESLLDAIQVQLKIARVTMPGLRDGLNLAKVTAFANTVREIYDRAEQLAAAAGLNGSTAPLTVDLNLEVTTDCNNSS